MTRVLSAGGTDGRWETPVTLFALTRCDGPSICIDNTTEPRLKLEAVQKLVVAHAVCATRQGSPVATDRDCTRRGADGYQPPRGDRSTRFFAGVSHFFFGHATHHTARSLSQYRHHGPHRCRETTTTERILYYTGKNYKIGEVHEGTATMDWMEQEQERGITITSAATTCFWTRHGIEYRINIIDTPGHVDFTVEVERSLRVLDGAVTLLDSVAGVEPQTETVWRQADRYGVPRLIFANKMDRVGADFDRCLTMIRDRLAKKAFPIQLPVGSAELFTGHIDVLRRVQIVFDEDSLGKTFAELPVPAAYHERTEQARHDVIDAAVEYDEELLEKYLGGTELTVEEIRRAIRKATISGGLVPVLCGAAFKNKGVQDLLDAVIDYLPAPIDVTAIKGHALHHDETAAERTVSDEAPFAALAFKIATDPFVGKLT